MKVTPKQYKEMIVKVQAEQCRRSMWRFMRDVVWEVVEPGVQFIDNWHLHSICAHLEAVLKGDIGNLLINMPPRFSKSLLVSVTMPTFAWIDKPELRSIFASYSSNMSIRDALKSRRVINSLKYQQFYGDRFQLSSDQDVKSRYENDKTGFRMSTSVGGAATGEGGDLLVVDDPHSVTEGESEVVREQAYTWWSETMSTRLNNPKKGGKIVVMQRVHESDVSGHILAEQAEEYEHLMIPMRFEEKRVCVTVLGKLDPREHEGELAWPDRFDAEAVTKLEKAMGPYAVAGQFQQTPSPRGGSLIDTSKIHIVDELPKEHITWVRCWDLAATEEHTGSEPAYTAGVLIGKWGHDENTRFIIGNVIRERKSPYAVRQLIKTTAERDGKAIKIRGPQDPGQAGKSQVGDLTAMLAGFNVIFVPETGSKEQRAEPFAAQVEGGNVYMLRAAWNVPYTTELGMFPAGKYKDMTDATANGFNELIPLPNSVGNLMEYMTRKLAAQKAAAENPNKSAVNPNYDRIQGAANVTDLGFLLATRR